MRTREVRPGVYVGSLRHRRKAPVMHAFTYPLFMALLDIDRMHDLMAASPFTSYNRWNWASFHESDHFGDPAIPLRQRLARDAESRGLALPSGPIFLLTHLRYLGYCFNPVSFFYCYDQFGALRLILAEVNNTFGGSHNYWLEPNRRPQSESPGDPERQAPGPHCEPSEAVQAARVFRASAAKSLYVSPFMPPDMAYRFAFTAPGERLVVHMGLERAVKGETPHTFDATLQLDFRPWRAREIGRALVRHPVMTATVTAGIHLEALRLWWKGLPIVPRPTSDGVHPDYAAPDTDPAMSER